MLNSIKSIFTDTLDYLFNIFLSEQTKNRTEFVILLVAIASFIIHLIISIIFLSSFKTHEESGLKISWMQPYYIADYTCWVSGRVPHKPVLFNSGSKVLDNQVEQIGSFYFFLLFTD